MIVASALLLVASLEIAPGELLVVPSVGRGGRVPVQTDAIQYAMAVGEWKAPTAGDKIRSVTGQEVEWRKITIGEDQWFRDRALNGGYAVWSFEHPREEIMLLEAAGHSMVYVNGEPRGGDVYGFGYTKLPVKLRRGTNEMLFNVVRGGVSIKVNPVQSKAFFNAGDLTLPDVVIGEADSIMGGIIVVNATEQSMTNLIISTPGNVSTHLPAIPALSARKVPFGFRAETVINPGEQQIELTLQDGSTVLDRTTVTVRVRKPTESHKRTFLSRIDASLQYYAVRPALSAAGSPDPAIVLTAHGAGVEAIGQVDAYASKSWAHLVAPTNRRPFGFDWEDWGRMDALEVLGLAQRSLRHDPSRIYLTGHSMGGHGTWILGVTYPGKFAAIGPSAGWISFFTYAGGAELTPSTSVESILKGATLPSDTASLVRNLAPLGVYILHGGADDNVPAAQARRMVEYLKEFHTSFEYHEQAGAGHWWDTSDEPGATCVDWPPMFDMFARRRIPSINETRSVQFITASPGISSKNGPVEILNLLKDGEFGEIQASTEPHLGLVTVKTKNVRCFQIDKRFYYGTTGKVSIDGQLIENPKETEQSTYMFIRRGDSWESIEQLHRDDKRPESYGPFKNAFNNRFVYVVGTKGTTEENAWMFAKARYDLETFWYRGNGAFDIVTDTEALSMNLSDRSIVLIGNADNNAAWTRFLPPDEIVVGRSNLKFGDFSSSRDDLAAMFVRPHPSSSRSLVAAIAFTGLKGARTVERSPYFVSGASFPDWLILSPQCLLSGNSEIVGAGFFGADWRIGSGNFAWGKR
ncbi:MAG: prolyl oligopeptidase family serine peptidase [Fimbriimonadales bacterium]|nr:prolyl oligopeptidase family serine peptidase [Fimbriimonadales bacterium]